MDRIQEAYIGDILVDDILGEVRLLAGSVDDSLFQVEVLSTGKKKMRAKSFLLTKGAADFAGASG
eukprot:5902588-Pleurochrysis_carterae.AAC.1